MMMVMQIVAVFVFMAMVMVMVMRTAVSIAVFVMEAMLVTHKRTPILQSSARYGRRNIQLQHNVAPT